MTERRGVQLVSVSSTKAQWQWYYRILFQRGVGRLAGTLVYWTWRWGTPRNDVCMYLGSAIFQHSATFRVVHGTPIGVCIVHSSDFVCSSEVTTALELVHTWMILWPWTERAMAFAVHLCVARGIRYVQPLDLTVYDAFACP